MRNIQHHLLAALLCVVFTAELTLLASPITYQGRLEINGAAANGDYDISFLVWSSPTGGMVPMDDQSFDTVPVSNGLFTVILQLDIKLLKDGAPWLELYVRPSGSTNDYTQLSPRQPLTSAPYAVMSESVTGPVQADQLAGTLPASVIADDTITSNMLAAGSVTSSELDPAIGLWTQDGTNIYRLEGSVGIGTETPRERLEVDEGNVYIEGVGGYDEAGESAFLYLGNTQNYIKATRDFGMNLGVRRVPDAVTVQQITGNVGIGTTNPATALQVAGTVTADAFAGTTNRQSLEFRVNDQPALRFEYSVASPNLIGGFSGNSVGSGTEGVVIAGGGRAGDVNTIGDNSDYSAIGGGEQNWIADRSWFATISGGSGNVVGTESDRSTIGGGYLNEIASYSSDASIAGGQRNVIGTNSTSSAIGGGSENTVQTNASYSTIGGGSRNDIGGAAFGATIAGGDVNSIMTLARSAAIGGGTANQISYGSRNATIAGGSQNSVLTDSYYSTIGGGSENSIWDQSPYATIGGGQGNKIRTGSSDGTVAGGLYNSIGKDASGATVGGGYMNVIEANSKYATVPGGRHNTAGGIDSFAAGSGAQALHDGSFVWADSTVTLFSSTGTNQFLIRAGGGVGIGTNNPQAVLHVGGTAGVDGIMFPDGTLQTSAQMVGPFGGPWQTNGSAAYYNQGNVGIGTETPVARLDVAGAGRLWELDLASVWGHVAFNAAWDGGIGDWRRIGDGYASLLQQNGSDGGMSLGVAGSGNTGDTVNWRWPLQLTRDGDVVIDGIGASETLSGGLRFGGAGSGEGVASSRIAGTNQWGLDFYTDNQPRLSIANNGNVGIGTRSPAETLDINGSIRVRSLPDKAQTEVAQLVVSDDQGQLKKTVGLPGGMLQRVTTQELVAPYTSQSFSVSCPSFFTVTGGGWYAHRNGTTSHDKDVYAYYNAPFSDGRGWQVGIRNDSGNVQNVTVYAICIRIH